MKYSQWILFLFSLSVWGSCTKDESTEPADGLVKTVDSVTMAANIGLIRLDDGKYIVISQGRMIKLDATARVEWKKSTAELSLIHGAVAEPGIGYILFGLPANSPLNLSALYAYRYDREGHFMDRHPVNANAPANYTYLPAFIIRLSHGGYAVATASSFSNCGLLKILDPDFNLVYSKAILPPLDYGTLTVRNFCELPDGDFVISAAVGHTTYQGIAYVHPLVILTGPEGITKSTWLTGDTLHSAVPYTATPCAGGFFAITSSMGEWGGTEGGFVDYYSGTCIAGSMHINRFNTEGQFTGSTEITGYPGFGLINSVHPVADGGFILCGTVNNNGSSFAISKAKVFVCKLDAGLNKQWSKVIQTSYQAVGMDAVPLSDGGFLVTGNMKSFNKNYQMLMIKTDANGNY